jgi:predicted nucleic acid-binding protein
MYLVDTNVVSELRKKNAGRADQKVVKWSQSIATQSLFISAITIMEIEIGILAMARKDPLQGNHLRMWMDSQVMPFFNGRILAMDTAVAQACAHLHVPDKKSERDAIIAATASVHNMTVVTRNIADFEGTGVKLFNPWDYV